MDNENKLSVRIPRTILRRVREWHIGRDLAACGLSNASKIHTFTHREELAALHNLAAQLPDGARVLEVGSYLGASTCYLAAGLRERKASIVCIDTWENQTMPDGVRDTFSEFKANTKGAAQLITTIRKRSDQVGVAELGAPYDLIFLDGDHSYAATKKDFQLAAQVLTPNGLLAFHDSRYFQGVSRVIGEAMSTGDWMLGGIIQNLAWLHRQRFDHFE
jgi:predicted O-methyltransferase YrrM